MRCNCRRWPVLTLILLAAVSYGLAQPPAPTPTGSPDDPADLKLPAVPETPEPVKEAAPKLQSLVPVVILERTSPQSINVGRTFVVETIVKNVGSAAAFQVRIEDVLPTEAKFIQAEPMPEVKENRLTWSLDSLEPGAERRLKVEMQGLKEAEIASKATVTFSTTVGVTTRITRPQLTLKKTGPETVVIGDTAPFRIEVTNTGTGPATNVSLRDQLPDGLEHAQGSEIMADIGTLAPGESRSLDLNVKAARLGRLTNQVTATGDDGLEAKASAVVNVGQPILKLFKRGPSERYLNAETLFVLEVVNTGDAPARKVQLIDALPTGLAFAAASDGGQYDQESHSVQWNLDVVQPGETRRVSLKVIPTTAGEMRNQAIVRGEPALDVKTEAIMNVVGVPALLLEVIDRDDPFEIGAESTYEVRVLNQGTAANTNVQVLVVVPEGMTLLRAEADVRYRIQGRQMIFAPLPKLAPQAEAMFMVTVRGDEPGDHRFKVQLQSDQLRIPVCEEESTKVYRDTAR